MALAVAAGFLIWVLWRVPPPSGRILAQTSQDWGNIPFGDGVCAVVNNTWNRAAGGNGFEQSVFIEDLSANHSVGWRWNAPWRLLPTVVSQPQIVCGNKPWDPRVRPDDGFPFLAGRKRLKAAFDVQLHARGIYNMAFTVWAVSAIPASRRNITHEIMIWTASAWLSPAGRRVDSMTVNGITYEVYIEPHQTDASGQNANTWTYVAFVPSTAVLRGPLDITAFTDYLIRRGTLKADQYVTSLEFGNEVSMGTGVAEIREFAIRVDLPSQLTCDPAQLGQHVSYRDGVGPGSAEREIEFAIEREQLLAGRVLGRVRRDSPE
jgi:Glycosyl hydrolase family 12